MQTGYFRVFKYIKMKRPKSTVNELRGPHAQADQIAASLSGMEDSHLQAGPNMRSGMGVWNPKSRAAKTKTVIRMIPKTDRSIF